MILSEVLELLSEDDTTENEESEIEDDVDAEDESDSEDEETDDENETDSIDNENDSDDEPDDDENDSEETDSEDDIETDEEFELNDDRIVKTKTDLFDEMASFLNGIKDVISKLESNSISDKLLNEAVNKYIKELSDIRFQLSDYLRCQFIGNSYTDNLYMFETIKRHVRLIRTHMYNIFNFKQNSN